MDSRITLADRLAVKWVIPPSFGPSVSLESFRGNCQVKLLIPVHP